jgi:CRISPR-associated protein Cas2
MKSTYIVCYDISNDKSRGKIEKIISAYGRRIQFSVFECTLDKSTKVVMIKRLKEAFNTLKIDKNNDSVRVYRICEFCNKEIDKLGKDKSVKNECLII